jgi:CHAT domain-containing protein
MEHFYRTLLTGKSVSEAVLEAQAWSRKQPDTAHPYYWAAFSTFGLD